MDKDIKEKQEWNELFERLNDFTTFLNKNQKEYSIKRFDSGNGFFIHVDKITVNFYLSGLIEFEKQEVEQ